ncbi:MAG: CRISPR-associated endonuclease Cas2 [Lachnospiraceae bacterium]|nr:CRISPR-associated endonuclease Cas2 [Lachnospiraceae bacterium]
MYLVSYDIEKTKIRNKIAKTLENYGERVQYSVFECRITAKQLDELYAKLAKIMSGKTEGNIRFYNLCKNCEEKIATIGVKEKEMQSGDEDIIII